MTLQCTSGYQILFLTFSANHCLNHFSVPTSRVSFTDTQAVWLPDVPHLAHQCSETGVLVVSPATCWLMSLKTGPLTLLRSFQCDLHLPSHLQLQGWLCIIFLPTESAQSSAPGLCSNQPSMNWAPVFYVVRDTQQKRPICSLKLIFTHFICFEDRITQSKFRCYWFQVQPRFHLFNRQAITSHQVSTETKVKHITCNSFRY